jgi:hypothetical protein
MTLAIMRTVPRLVRLAAIAALAAGAVKMRSRLAAAALLASLAALMLLVSVAPASGAIDPRGYQHVDVVYDYPAPYGYAGGYAFCPAGMKAVASGATSSGLRDVGVTVGFTTFDATGAFVKGFGDAGGHLQVSARCVDAGQVQGSTLATTVVRDHTSSYAHDGRATCPPGTIAYGGGGFLSQPGSQPFGSVYASMPDANGSRWLFGTAGGVDDTTELWVSTHCLPRREFGQILTVTATDSAPPGVPRWPYPTLFTAAHCPTGYAAYAGGAWLHRAGSSTPEMVGNLTVSNMIADDTGWFARAWISTEGAQLTATVQCMTAVGAVVPDVVELSKRGAGQRVSAAGLAPRFTGATTSPDAYVDSQTPAPSTIVASGSTVTMHLRAEPTCGPNPC